MNDRPSNQDGGDDDGFGRSDDAAWGSAEDEQPDDAPRPIRARDLLAEPDDPSQFGAVPIIEPGMPDPEADSGDSGPALPHWTDPPTGEVPRILGSTDDDLEPWAAISSSQPRWRDQSNDWSDGGVNILGEDLPRMGVRDDSAAQDDFFTFDDTEAAPDPYSVPRDPSEPYGGRGADPYAEGRSVVPSNQSGLSRVVVGVGLTALGLFLLNIGPAATMALVVAALVLASAEMLSTLRRIGYSPPALVGLTAAAALPLAAYWRGEPGLVLALVLTVLVCLLWYLFGIGTDHAVPNIGVTLLTVLYVAVLGSFAALLLRSPDGAGLLLAALIGAVIHDVVALGAGKSMGRSPLSSASPNKTREGTIAGMVAALLVTWVVVGGVVGPGIAPFNSSGNAFILGLAIAAVAPLDDLCESMLKRDLGVKDMGTLLPGHGGVLDRFDAILFALPATYYVALVVL